MPTSEQYEELRAAARKIIEVSRAMYPNAGDEAVALVVETAIEFELEQPEAA